MARHLDRVRNRVVDLVAIEGSTRAIAAMRIGFIFLLWARYTGRIPPYKWMGDPFELATSTLFFASSWLAFVGLWTRASMAVLAGVMTVLYVYHGAELGHPGFRDAHHAWQVTVLLALMPCGRSLSVDRWLAVRRAAREGRPPPPERGPLWATHLVLLQLVTIYGFAASDKIDPQWLAGERIDRVWIELYGSSDDLPGEPLLHAGSVAVAWMTTACEAFIAVGFCLRRLRAAAMIVGVVFHLGLWFFLALWPLTPTLLLSYLACIDHARFHRLVDELFGVGAGDRSSAG